MGINGLLNYLQRTNNIQYEQFNQLVFVKHNIVDFNNLLYKQQNNTQREFKPINRIQNVLNCCKQFANNPDKQFYIVLDPIGKTRKQPIIDFKQYQDIITTYSDRKCELMFNNSDICAKYNNGYVDSYYPFKYKKADFNHWQTAKFPIYNDIICMQYFKDLPNVEVIYAPVEADITIGQLVQRLQTEAEVTNNDINIFSYDSDMLIYSNGVNMQTKQYIINMDTINKQLHFKYIYIIKYISITYADYFNLEEQHLQTLFDKVYRQNIQQVNLKFMLDNIKYSKYDQIDQIQLQLSQFNINTLGCAIIFNLLFLQPVYDQHLTTSQLIEQYYNINYQYKLKT